MRNQALLPPDLLRREIARLRPAVEGGKGQNVGQQKSELAAMLYEAHRTGAHREWGHKNLGTYMATLGVKPDAFAKYKAAGKILYVRRHDLYTALMAAVMSKSARPPLPKVSELAARPSLEKQVGADHEIMNMGGLGAPIGKRKTLADEVSYGSATEEGRRVLGRLDAFVQEAGRARDMLGALPGEQDVPPDQLGRRVQNIRTVCEGLLAALEPRAPKR
jgi:hypothetical protein